MECFIDPIFLLLSFVAGDVTAPSGAVTMLQPSLAMPIQSEREHDVTVKLVEPAAELEDELQAEGKVPLATRSSAAPAASPPRAG